MSAPLSAERPIQLAGLSSIFLLVSTSSLVWFEPAPYDVLAIALIAGWFVLGLRVPRALALPLVLIGLFALANVVSLLAAGVGAGYAPGLGLQGEQARMEAVLARGFTGPPLFAAVTIYLAATIPFVACLVYRDPQRVCRAIWLGYLTAALLAASAAVLAYFGLIPGAELFLKASRAKGTFKDPNVLGPFLVPAVLYLALETARRTTILLPLKAGLLFLLVAALLVTFSRGAWVNLAVSGCVLGWLYVVTRRHDRTRFRFVSLGAAVAVASLVLVVVLVNTTQVGELFYHRAAFFHDYDVAQGGRFDLQRRAAVDALFNPLGVGPNGTEARFGMSPHNVYLKVAAENGWLGALSFCALLGLTFWRGLRCCWNRSPVHHTHLVVFAALAGLIVQSPFIDVLHWRHFYFFVGMMWGCILVSRPARD